eukprot:6177851-Pleurochrysis_carterae.AAC.1
MPFITNHTRRRPAIGDPPAFSSKPLLVIVPSPDVGLETAQRRARHASSAGRRRRRRRADACVVYQRSASTTRSSYSASTVGLHTLSGAIH